MPTSFYARLCWCFFKIKCVVGFWKYWFEMSSISSPGAGIKLAVGKYCKYWKLQPTLLLLPRLVADGRPQMDSRSVLQATPRRAHQHSEAALLQYVHVMVVRVPHGPAGRVSSRFLARRGVHLADVAVAPLAEGVEGRHSRDHGVVDVPLRGGVWHIRAASGGKGVIA